MMALMAIMILCSAATCTVSGDDDDRFDNYDNEEQLAATSWKAVYFSDGYEWLDTEDYGCDFTITFFQNEYQATFTERVYDGRVSTRDHIYQGQYSAQYNTIHCYDGSSSNESIRIDITRTGNGQMETTVNLVSIGERYTVRMLRK